MLVTTFFAHFPIRKNKKKKRKEKLCFCICFKSICRVAFLLHHHVAKCLLFHCHFIFIRHFMGKDSRTNRIPNPLRALCAWIFVFSVFFICESKEYVCVRVCVCWLLCESIKGNHKTCATSCVGVGTLFLFNCIHKNKCGRLRKCVRKNSLTVFLRNLILTGVALYAEWLAL